MAAFPKARGALCSLSLCLVCLTFLAFPARAEEGYIELGEDSNGAWSLYLPSVEERAYSSYENRRYIAGWVQVIFKRDEGSSLDELNIEELAQGDQELAQALEFLAGLGRMLNYNEHERYRGMFLYAANKELKQIQRISAAYYDEEGGEISSSNSSFNRYSWKECPPGSMDEKIWLALTEAAKRLK